MINAKQRTKYMDISAKHVPRFVYTSLKFSPRNQGLSGDSTAKCNTHNAVRSQSLSLFFILYNQLPNMPLGCSASVSAPDTNERWIEFCT